jgi:hypothetical protein
MRTYSVFSGAALIAIGIVSVWAGVTSAQNRGAQQASVVAQADAPVPANLSRPTGRFGRTLGLPKDGNDLFIADADYIRFPLPPGEGAYADVDPMKIKAMIGEITAISRKSRDDGNQYWGRIPGTAYDRMTQDWVMDQFRKIGLRLRIGRCRHSRPSASDRGRQPARAGSTFAGGHSVQHGATAAEAGQRRVALRCCDERSGIRSYLRVHAEIGHGVRTLCYLRCAKRESQATLRECLLVAPKGAHVLRVG